MENNKENAIIRLEGLGKQFQTSGGPVTALENTSLEICSGEVFGIIESSGADKSALVRCINYLEVPTSDKVIFEGKNLSAMEGREKWLARRSMGMIFQQLNPPVQGNVLQDVYFPLEIAGTARGKAKKRVEGLLRLVDLEDRTKTYPVQLLDGQKQRVAIARAIAINPKILLRNEAAGILDPNTTRSTLELLKRINREMEITVTVITREMAVIEMICDRAAIIDHGHITEVGKVSEIFSGPKSDIDRQLVLGDVTAQRTSFGTSRQICIIFDGRESSESVITSMILTCKVLVNIMRADTRNIEGRTTGQMVTQLPEDDTDADRTCSYLRIANAAFEEVR